jgi:dynein heavy chain
VMDALIVNLSLNQVPNGWLKICGQVGPTGSYNRKTLSNWFIDLLSRVKQLKTWSEKKLILPPSIWLPGMFNPMGYVTACMQVTARAKSLPLDSMTVHTEFTQHESSQVTDQPKDGTYVHGFFMEGARWDKAANLITDSRPKELHPTTPVMHITGVTSDQVVTTGVYQCPIYTTTIRGPTFVFPAPLRSDRPSHAWILAAVCLLCQPDQ